MMTTDWRQITVSADETFHLIDAQPLYAQRFVKVLKFHAPGLAPVCDEEGAYHINTKGEALYPQRYLQTFGYYCDLAAVAADDGWLHIDTQGNPIYGERYRWCGNFQEDLCTVQNKKNQCYFHIDRRGERIYAKKYRYAGDFRDGVAVVCAENGLHTHINKQGDYLHQQWFSGLDVFHKGVARAKDANGWFHINRRGEALYRQRFSAVEPYYNNVAHVEDFAGNLLTIDLNGDTLTRIAAARQPAALHELSADLVGFWKTQTIYAAVRLGIFDALPASLSNLAQAIKLDASICRRLLRALHELKLVEPETDNDWRLTPKGQLLKPLQTSAMAAAAIIWGDSHYLRWMRLTEALQETHAQTAQYFNQLADDKPLLATYHKALAGYAEQDYSLISTQINWRRHNTVIDAGGGVAALLHQLLENHPHLQGVLLEMPAVIALVSPQPRCRYYGTNLLMPWPCRGDAILLARVLHDWNDDEALQILNQAKNSLTENGRVYVLEMLLTPTSAQGGLLDLNMLVMTGGRERTLADFQRLAEQAGLALVDATVLSPVIHLIQLMPCGLPQA